MKPSPGAVMAVAAKPTELRVRMLFCACINFLQGQNENTHQNDDSGRKFHDQALLGGIVVIMASAISEGIAAGPRLSLIIGHGYGDVPAWMAFPGRRSDDITDVCMAKPRGNVGAGSGGAARSDTPCRGHFPLLALRHGHGIPSGGDGNMRCWATSEFVARTSGRPWKGADILGNPRHGCCGSNPNNSKGASCRFRGKGVCDEQIMTALRHDDGTEVQVFGREGGGRNLGGSASRGGEQRRAMAR
ncbi:hypothetical protein VFPBJ_04758 [Purpureocillium lilacinum]|uniref:Uncharacterized protein n=1 Tax=Purpureocillium lilacinum TaxID=33203 RepID=A0A179GW98_PURLI|nr:hypothetical protein VFPBJ_04758 [Purpureocillium lilacinum]